MSRHIAPVRWNDLWAGRVGEAERAQMEKHAARCPACAKARERVTRASDSFAPIRAQASPELPWDTVRARVHWAVSKERRTPPKRRVPASAWGLLAISAAAAIALVVGPGMPRMFRTDAPVAHAPVAPPAIPAPIAAPAPAPLIGLVSRAAGDVMVDGVRPTDLFSRELGRGTVLATGDGHLDVQFGEASGFALGPRSTLELRAFDASRIELVVNGTVDVEVAPRAPNQMFLVIAGDHTIEVRGTQFRVTHAGTATTVACRHGLVAVRDPKGEVEVASARRVEVHSDHPVTGERVVALSADELNTLAQAVPMTLPSVSLDALARTSAPLEIAAVGHREVRVDGVELGLAPLRVRVLPGRHTVEVTDAGGRYRRAGWVDVTGKAARFEVAAEPPSTAGVGERRRQLRAGIDHARIARCMRSIAKAGLDTSTYVEIELAVDANGAIGFLNVLDTDLPSTTSRCIRDALAEVRFGAGAPATWRERVDL